MNREWLLTMLGFAQKAGKLAAGESAVENFLKRDRIRLMIASMELAEEKKNMWESQAIQHEIPFYQTEATKAELGLAVGMSPRGIIGIMDDKMAEAIMQRLQ